MESYQMCGLVEEMTSFFLNNTLVCFNVVDLIRSLNIKPEALFNQNIAINWFVECLLWKTYREYLSETCILQLEYIYIYLPWNRGLPRSDAYTSAFQFIWKCILRDWTLWKRNLMPEYFVASSISSFVNLFCVNCLFFKIKLSVGFPCLLNHSMCIPIECLSIHLSTWKL